MTGFFQEQFSILVNLRLHGVHLEGQLGFGKDAVQLHQDFKVVVDVLLISRSLGGKLRQNPLDFLSLPGEQLPQGVVGVDRLHGFDKEGAAGGGHVMNQARHVGLAFALDRNHKAVGADGDNRLPQVLCVGR